MASDKIQVVEEFIYNNLQTFLYIFEYRLQQKKKKKTKKHNKFKRATSVKWKILS